MSILPVPADQSLIALLEECALPVADISPSSPIRFFGIRSDTALVGVIGLELYPPFGLLRSLAVASTHRGQGLGRVLVRHAESFAASQGIETLFLLTTTAEQFFLDLGYSNTSRDTAPLEIKATSQFASLCPASSSFLSRHLVAMD